MEADKIKALKQKRASRLATLTRIRRRAFVMIDGERSRTQLGEILKELGTAVDQIAEVNDEYLTLITDKEEETKAMQYMKDVQTQHDEAAERIQQYFVTRKGDPPSVASSHRSSRASRVSVRSDKYRDAEIEEKLKVLKLKQLEKRCLEEKEERELRQRREREEEEIQQRRRRKMAQDEIEISKLKTNLTKAAEDDLTWERREDFIDEDDGDEQVEDRREDESKPVQGSGRATHTEGISKRGQDSEKPKKSRITKSLPKISMPKFSGNVSEWPTWYGLFKALVHEQEYLTLAEKMIHLQSSVSGLAQQLIGGMLCDPNLYQQALTSLEERFGRETDIVQAKLNAIFNRPAVTSRLHSLEHFYADVNSAVTVLQSLEFKGDLKSQENLRRIVEKLPTELKREWGKHVTDNEPAQPDLLQFNQWLKRQVRVALNCPTSASMSDQQGCSYQQGAWPKERSSSGRQRTQIVAAFTTSTGQQSRTWNCLQCGATHELRLCPSFLAKTSDERSQFVAANRCCFGCLKVGHLSRDCRTARSCGIQGCTLRHNRLLHGSKRVRKLAQAPSAVPTADPARGAAPSQAPSAGPTADPARSATTNQLTIASVSSGGDRCASTVLLQVVPVRVHGSNGRSKDTLALLDPGAQTSLCCESLLQELSITGPSLPLRLHNVESDGDEKLSQRVQLELSPLADTEDCTHLICVPEAYSVERVNVRTPAISSKNKRDWAHLEGISIPDCTRGDVELLLGANVLEAVLQTEARVGKHGQPTAIRTAFGWSLTGSISDIVPGQIREVLFLQKSDPELTESLQEWWSTEAFGTRFTGEALPPEEYKAMQLLEKTTRRVGVKYEVGLLWRDESAEMPDNYNVAFKRLISLEKSLQRDPQKAQAYKETLEGYITQGYAKKLLAEETKDKQKKRWILPHHAVTRLDKPKPRVVFDAAAELHGVSLNSELLKGPDLLQNLCGVLLRFREERYAFVADIREMFHQIKVRPQDQPALSFLWRGLDPTREPDLYQMLVVIFGAKCSPTIANYVLRRALTENAGTGNTDVKRESLCSSFYMDDFLRSDATVEAAKSTRLEVQELLTQGGFHLTKWRSNCQYLLEDVGENERDVTQKKLVPSKDGSQKALGCVWTPDSDSISVAVKEVEVPPTKRGVLRRTAMVFDPLGIISPFVLLSKNLMQRLWTLKLGWDDKIYGEELATWESWLEELPKLQEISIPRCLKTSGPNEIENVQLHMFSDASEVAFAAAGYLRTTDVSGRHHSALIMARSRLAPLKQLSIVRLELQGAVLAVRLADVIRKEMSYNFDESVYWSDSQVVLQFIANESRLFHTFVANRVAEIRNSSDPSEWRHVPGIQNPADICSRGMSVSQLKKTDVWWNGPAFLQKDRQDWPSLKIPGLDPSAPELKRKSAEPTISFVGDPTTPRVGDPAAFSSWRRYKRVVAWIRRFTWNLNATRKSNSKRTGPLSTEELTGAEKFIIRDDQARNQTDTPPGLSLFRDEEGLIRVKGRLSSAPLAEKARQPIALAPDSEVTRLIVTDIHERVMHSGLGHSLNQFRERYWMPKARAGVKKIIWRCVYCRNRRSKPSCPKMADLPQERFDTSRPFSSVGLDFLGPLLVRKFRKTEKRYVLLVTCLATRAIHLEVAQSMDTDSFLMALRRFIARRGKPRVIWSDNGSNLVGGERELRESLSEWNQQQIADSLSQDDIQWKFNPPTASHMGGIWERLVASVKRALRVVLGNHVVSDDVLHTTLAEIEYMLNSRPLTYVSGDSQDPEALTPNHFLMGTMPRGSGLPPGVFGDSDTLSRKRWRQTQALANQVWRRWKKEYVPTLMARQKWNHESDNLGVRDVVLLAADDAPRGYWPLGVIEEVYPSADGIVRSALVRTAGGVYKRPCTKLCILERQQHACT